MTLAKIRISDDNYLYASARVRARAANGIDAEILNRMTEARDAGEVFRILSEHGINVINGEDGTPDTEATLDTYLNSEFEVVQSFTHDPEICDLLRYPYDAHNLKSAIKSEMRGTSGELIYIDLGSVSASYVTEMMTKRDFGAFPENMAAAAAKAIEEFDKTSDPQRIDIAIDRACYADMLALAERINKSFFSDTLRTKIDVTNILTALRVMRMGADESYFSSCYIDGGKLSLDFHKKLIASGQEGFSEKLVSTDYSYIAAALEAGGRLADAERICDNCYIDKLRTSYSIAYGAEVPYSYLALKDYEVRNIRIIITSKKVGLSPAEIRAKLRGI